MKRIYHLFFLLFFTLTCGSIHAQNLIYQKVEQAKNNGKKFDLVKDVFTRTESNREVLRAFKNPDEVNFMTYNSASVDELPLTISVEILLDNKLEILELMAVDNDFYNYVVTTSANESFGANRDIKHYRGVLKGNASSLVAVSFSKDHVGGVIANGKGNYNISLQEKSKTIAIFNGNNILNTQESTCEVIELDSNNSIISSQINSLANPSKCIKVKLEAEYDLYLSQESDLLLTESHLATIFNQVSTLFQNENITIGISEIKIWKTEDPFTGNNRTKLVDQYRPYIAANGFNGHISMLITNENNGGIAYRSNVLDICHNKAMRIGVSGINGLVHIVPDYSRPVKVFTHELGHIFGSHHTHDCVWNGNNSAIDSCGPLSGYPGDPSNCANGPLPVSGTIMSYCDQSFASSPGVDFLEGFGMEPGNRIRTTANNSSCATSCPEYCFENLYLSTTVPIFAFDGRKVSNDITAANEIKAFGSADYSAGNSIILKPGFRSYSGSTSHIYIEGCYPMEVLGSSTAETDQATESKNLFKEELSVNLYPNPTPDVITIESNQEIIFWELTNDVGNMYRSGKVDNLKKFQLNFADLNMGVYNIKIHLANGEFSYKKMIKQ